MITIDYPEISTLIQIRLVKQQADNKRLMNKE